MKYTKKKNLKGVLKKSTTRKHLPYTRPPVDITI